jgi:hypothetical protein
VSRAVSPLPRPGLAAASAGSHGPAGFREAASSARPGLWMTAERQRIDRMSLGPSITIRRSPSADHHLPIIISDLSIAIIFSRSRSFRSSSPDFDPSDRQLPITISRSFDRDHHLPDFDPSDRHLPIDIS